MKKLLLIGTAAIAVCAAAVWVWHSRGLDAWSALAAAVAALVTTIVAPKTMGRSNSMSQQVRRGSIAIQSGRDTNIHAKSASKSSDG